MRAARQTLRAAAAARGDQLRRLRRRPRRAGGEAAGIPLLVHEQNRAPGLTNRVLAKFARRVLTGFPQTFAGGREEVVGNPVRTEIAAIAPPSQRFAQRDGAAAPAGARRQPGRARAERRGAGSVARAARGTPIEVRHQCGEKLRADAEAAYAQAGIAASVEPFIADMAAAYAWADLVVCRAGALTLAELCAAGVGSVLVPFPQAVDDHQTRNAEYLVERGAALLLKQDDALAARLADVLRDLAGHADKRRCDGRCRARPGQARRRRARRRHRPITRRKPR